MSLKHSGMCGCGLADGPDTTGYQRRYCPECGRNWYDPPVPVTLVLVTTDDGNVVYTRKRTFEPGRWSVVSGFIPKGERAEDAAVREVKEETGLDARIVDSLGEVVYFYRRPRGLTRKVVHHFLMEYTGGEFGPPNWEVDEARWVDIDQAHTLFTYKNDLGIVRKAKERLFGVKSEE